MLLAADDAAVALGYPRAVKTVRAGALAATADRAKRESELWDYFASQDLHTYILTSIIL